MLAALTESVFPLKAQGSPKGALAYLLPEAPKQDALLPKPFFQRHATDTGHCINHVEQNLVIRRKKTLCKARRPQGRGRGLWKNP